jgi:diguanylate cyclase (GGDEF)-like protein
MRERIARRTRGTIGLMMFDVDHFKRFNDTYGHDAGDEVLRAIAGVLRQQARGEDIACRYGGEELCLVMPGASADIMRARSERIREAVAVLNLRRGGVSLGEVTVSIGVAGFPDNGETWQIALRDADAALYRAKRNGRNRVETAS